MLFSSSFFTSFKMSIEYDSSSLSHYRYSIFVIHSFLAILMFVFWCNFYMSYLYQLWSSAYDWSRNQIKSTCSFLFRPRSTCVKRNVKDGPIIQLPAIAYFYLPLPSITWNCLLKIRTLITPLPTCATSCSLICVSWMWKYEEFSKHDKN